MALTIPLTIAALASPVQVLVGDWAARDVAEKQPTKLAAIEGLYKTTSGAPEHILGWYTDDQVKYGIAIPHLLSLLSFHSWNAKVQGLDAVPASQRPPVNVVRFAFQTMVGIGTLLALLGALYLVVWIRRRSLPDSRLFYAAVVLAGPAALVALISGWVVTEVGRQPWVVYRVMPTSAAVTGAARHPGRLRRARRQLRGDRVRAGLGAAAAGRARCGCPESLNPTSAPTPSPPDRCSCKRSPWCSCWPVWPSTRCSPAPTSGPGSGSCRPAAASAPSASASTPTSRWRRCGRPTTSG